MYHLFATITVTALVGTVRAVGIYRQEIGATGGERRQDGPEMHVTGRSYINPVYAVE